MDIDLGNIGIRTGVMGASSAVSMQKGSFNAPAASANLTIGEHLAGISSGEPVADVPEAALTRDDKLGMLVNSAFNLPPPAMPEFK